MTMELNERIELAALNKEIADKERELTGLYRARRGRILEEKGDPDSEDWRCVGYCAVCGVNTVDAGKGEDTCGDCIEMETQR